MIDWCIEGLSFGNCNCAYSCPCQFEQLPTHGDCRGFEAVHIERGHFGDVKLDGCRFAVLYAWPGPIFEGHGEVQAIIDERTDDKQREALLRIIRGEETEEAATHFWVFHAMSETVHDTLYLPVDFDVDIDARTARVSIANVLESTGRPIISPATGEPHRVRIDMPEGIEFDIAEIGSATTRADAAIRLDLDDSYGQFNRLHQTGKGVVRN